MAKALLLSGTLLLFPVFALAEVPVRFAPETPFLVQASATGIASRNSRGVSLFLDSIKLEVDERAPIAIHVTGLRIGVVFINSAIGRWDISHWSSVGVLDKHLSPGKPLELKNVAVEIPVGEVSLKDRWLLIEVQIVTPTGQKGTTYAHTSRRVFDGQGF